MFHKILVAIDRSPLGKQVFEEALALAKGHNASLMLLHVLSPCEEDYPSMPSSNSLVSYPGMHADTVQQYLEQLEDLKKKGLELLQSLTAQATAAGVKTEFTYTPGNPAYTICDLARSWDADLIVMGRRGLSGIPEVVLGSVSNYVTHHARCSVLTVHIPSSRLWNA